jgi:hypothetical protein
MQVSLAVRTLGVTAALGVLLFAVSAAWAQDPWADEVISYDPGEGAQPGYTDPLVVLGEPERYTGEGSWPGAVTPFNPAWLPEEVVSLGAGGRLIVRFDEPITNDPDHVYGVDFIIFGNGSFADGDYPNGQVAGLFEEGPFAVSVSADGVDFTPLAGLYNDALFPALGYLDLAGPYDPNPGSLLSDFTRPINPDLTYDDFHGRSFEEVLAIYDGSGGGIPFDISATGLSAVSYVRIDVPAGATSPELDGFAAVPEPASMMLVGTLVLAGALRRGR